MSEDKAIFIFSLGPVQGFIAEARRLADLDAGSRLLVKLATAGGRAIEDRGGSLIFPGELGDDVPNKLVARVPADRAEEIAHAAQQAIQGEWQRFGKTRARAWLPTAPLQMTFGSRLGSAR